MSGRVRLVETVGLALVLFLAMEVAWNLRSDVESSPITLSPGSVPRSSGEESLFVTAQPVIYVPFVVTATATVRPTLAPTWTPRPTTPTAPPRICRPGTPEPGVRCYWPTMAPTTPTAQSCTTMHDWYDANEWCVWPTERADQ